MAMSEEVPLLSVMAELQLLVLRSMMWADSNEKSCRCWRRFRSVRRRAFSSLSVCAWRTCSSSSAFFLRSSAFSCLSVSTLWKCSEIEPNQPPTDAAAERNGCVTTPAALWRNPVVDPIEDSTHSTTAISVAAARIQMPFLEKNFFMLSVPQSSRFTPTCASIRLSSRTGRPMTLKKSPSIRSTSSAPCPCTP